MVLWAPLPPLLSAYSGHAVRTELRFDYVCGSCEMRFSDRDFLSLDPSRRRHPLRSESLDIIDSMGGSVLEELANQMETFVVGEVCCRFTA